MAQSVVCELFKNPHTLDGSFTSHSTINHISYDEYGYVSAEDAADDTKLLKVMGFEDLSDLDIHRSSDGKQVIITGYSV